MVLSSGIIFFYAANGKLSDNTLKLPLINLEFQNTSILVLFIWASLFYLCWRFWQELPITDLAHYRAELVRKPFNIPLRWYIKKRTGLTHRIKDGFVVTDWNPIRFTVTYDTVRHITEDNNALISNNNVKLKIYGIYGTLLKLFIIMYSVVRQSYFSEHFIPLILFFLACLFGLLDIIS